MDKDNEPQFKSQMDPYGKAEKVDVTVYNFKVMCSEPGCMEVRYIKAQDRAQVKHCKPHSRMARLRSRAMRARANRKTKK
jgi:hypothetical protein